MAYCVVNDEEVGDVCPHNKGDCYYQHVETQHCKYAKYKTTAQFCKATGREALSDKALAARIADFRQRLRDELP